ncbi:MAG: hypothetical protein NTW10_02445 [Bacteroidetes bacterium]|nr:hypothetical protein [Bacteroidota bacterium]
MKKNIALFCSCILMQVAYTQNLIVDDTLALKKGIYKTYQEFKLNSPSIPLDYNIQAEILVYSNLSQVEAFTHRDTCYTLKIEKEKANETGTVWGFCDGKNVYINRETSISSGKVIFKPYSKFYKLLFIGRYCYFKVAYRSGGGFTYGILAIDFNSGELLELSKNKVKKYISKDEKLYHDFNNEGSWNDSTFFRYLKLYSEKHKDEIKRN